MLNIKKWIKLSVSTDLLVIMFGLPRFFWNIDEAIQECKMKEHKIHLCNFGLQYDEAPSGSYFKLATNSSGSLPGKCNCSELLRTCNILLNGSRKTKNVQTGDKGSGQNW